MGVARSESNANEGLDSDVFLSGYVSLGAPLSPRKRNKRSGEDEPACQLKEDTLPHYHIEKFKKTANRMFPIGNCLVI